MRFSNAGASDRTNFMDAGHTREAVPLVAATFTPAGDPALSMRFLYMWAKIKTATAKARLITPIECSGIHIALLSSHII